MKIECSNGEIVDKFIILGIKAVHINQKFKLKHVFYEMYELEKAYKELIKMADNAGHRIRLVNYFDELYKVNETLWDIEEKIREKESRKEFDEEFIGLARDVYINNDERSRIKGEINRITSSELIEEKSYEDNGPN